MKRVAITSILILVSYFAFSQNWQNRNNVSGKMNFYEIQNSFNQDLKDGKVSVTFKEYKQYKRWERYWKDRILEDGSFINPMHTYFEKKKYEEKHLQIKGDADWTFIGPNVLPDPIDNPGYPGLGRINAIAFDPTNNSIIWVGSPSGGLWKSSDGGNTWTTTTDEWPSLGVSDIAINPTNNQIMYVATGDADAQHTQSVGVLKSIDGGNTWALTELNYELNETRQTARILLDPEETDWLIVSTNNGIYFTDNGGEDWYISEGTAGVYFHSLIYKAYDNSIIYAGGKNGIIYRSNDFGQSFNTVFSGAEGRVELAVTPADPDFIFAFFEDGTGAYSDDGGENWYYQNMPQNNGENINTQGGYNMCVAIAPDNPDLIIVGAMNYAYRTFDGGESWEGYLDGYWQPGKPYFYVHSDHHVLKFLPGSNSILFSGNDGGLHKGDITTNEPWTDLTSGLFITQYYGIGGTPEEENYLLAGAQDNDVNGWDGSDWWDINNNTDGVECLIDYSNPNISYAASTSGNISRTLDGYATAEEWLDGPTDEDAGFEWPIVMDPLTPTTLYGGWTEIYKSTDKGDTWNAITNNQLGGSVWTHIAIAPSDPNTIYAGDYQTVWLTTNGGTSWEEITGSNFPSANITKIAVNATDPNTAFITFAGYEDGKKVYFTDDAGMNWTNITGSLPNIPVKCIVYQTGSNDDLYIGTDLGVFHIDNQLDDWEEFNKGLPSTIVNDLEIYYGTEKIRAATFGRGIWESKLANSTGIDNNFSNISFQIFPNPTNGVFKINIDNPNSEIIIYNTAGGVIKQVNKVETGVMNFDLSNYCEGLYFVSIKSDTKQQTAKLIIK
jgi:photosystem II stability/assembly factor-like uncharacterized protein